jgi:hypothetical protein
MRGLNSMDYRLLRIQIRLTQTAQALTFIRTGAGLNPTNSASVLAMLTPTATNNANGITVSWQSVSGISYNLQRSTNLSTQPFSNIQNGIAGQTGTTSYTNTTATNNLPYFYRVGVP